MNKKIFVSFFLTAAFVFGAFFAATPANAQASSLWGAAQEQLGANASASSIMSLAKNLAIRFGIAVPEWGIPGSKDSRQLPKTFLQSITSTASAQEGTFPVTIVNNLDRVYRLYTNIGVLAGKGTTTTGSLAPGDYTIDTDPGWTIVYNVSTDGTITVTSNTNNVPYTISGSTLTIDGYTVTVVNNIYSHPFYGEVCHLIGVGSSCTMNFSPGDYLYETLARGEPGSYAFSIGYNVSTDGTITVTSNTNNVPTTVSGSTLTIDGYTSYRINNLTDYQLNDRLCILGPSSQCNVQLAPNSYTYESTAPVGFNINYTIGLDGLISAITPIDAPAGVTVTGIGTDTLIINPAPVGPAVSQLCGRSLISGGSIPGYSNITPLPTAEISYNSSTNTFKLERDLDCSQYVPPNNNIYWALESEYSSDLTIDGNGYAVIANPNLNGFEIFNNYNLTFKNLTVRDASIGFNLIRTRGITFSDVSANDGGIGFFVRGHDFNTDNAYVNVENVTANNNSGKGLHLFYTKGVVFKGANNFQNNGGAGLSIDGILYNVGVIPAEDFIKLDPGATVDMTGSYIGLSLGNITELSSPFVVTSANYTFGGNTEAIVTEGNAPGTGNFVFKNLDLSWNGAGKVGFGFHQEGYGTSDIMIGGPQASDKVIVNNRENAIFISSWQNMHDISVSNVEADNNVRGIKFSGLNVGTISNVNVTHNRITNSSNSGLYLGGIDNVLVSDNTISDNATGLGLALASNLNIFHNNIYNNGTPQTSADQAYDYFNASIQEGNYWGNPPPCELAFQIPKDANQGNDAYPYVVLDGWVSTNPYKVAACNSTPPTVYASSLDLIPDTAEIFVGETVNFTANISPADSVFYSAAGALGIVDWGIDGAFLSAFAPDSLHLDTTGLQAGTTTVTASIVTCESSSVARFGRSSSASVILAGDDISCPAGYTLKTLSDSSEVLIKPLPTFTITSTPGPGCTIKPGGTQVFVRTVDQGASASYSIQPNVGYHIADVVVDENSVGAVPNYTFENVQTNHTLSANCAPDVITRLYVSVEETVSAGAGSATHMDTALETKVFSSAVGSCASNIGTKPQNYATIYNTCIAEATANETFSPTEAPSKKPRNLISDLAGIDVSVGSKLVLVKSRPAGINADKASAYMGFDLPNIQAGESRDVGFNRVPGQPNNFVQKSMFSQNSKYEWSGSNRAEVILGSELYVYRPDFVEWTNGDQIYPFTFISDSDWDLNICLQVPAGYTIVAPGTCDQTLISNEAKIVEFKVSETAAGSAAAFLAQAASEPEFTMTLQTKHTENGQVKETNTNYKVSGIKHSSKVANDAKIASVVAAEKVKALAVITQAAAVAPIVSVQAPGGEIMNLQKYLNAKGFTVSTTGAGSPGYETNVLGPRTRAALIKFQDANASEILAPIGLQKGTGVYGPRTKAFIQAHQ